MTNSTTKRIRLTPRELAAINRYMEANDIKHMSVVFRQALQAIIEDYPDEEITQGTRTDLHSD